MVLLHLSRMCLNTRSSQLAWRSTRQHREASRLEGLSLRKMNSFSSLWRARRNDPDQSRGSTPIAGRKTPEGKPKILVWYYRFTKQHLDATVVALCDSRSDGPRHCRWCLQEFDWVPVWTGKASYPENNKTKILRRSEWVVFDWHVYIARSRLNVRTQFSTPTGMARSANERKSSCKVSSSAGGSKFTTRIMLGFSRSANRHLLVVRFLETLL